MEVLRILSFDPGTAAMGWSLLDGDLTAASVELTEHFGVLRSSKQDGDVRSRIDSLGGSFDALIHAHHPTHVVIEDFTEQGKLVGKTYKEMSWLTEHLRLIGRSAGFEVTIYENAEWKKIATGAGRLSKDQVKHFVAHQVGQAQRRLGKRTPTHVWDSVGMGFAKFKQLRGEHDNDDTIKGGLPRPLR